MGYGGPAELVHPPRPARSRADSGGCESKAHHLGQPQSVGPEQVHDTDSIRAGMNTHAGKPKPTQSYPANAKGKRFSSRAQDFAVRAEREHQGQCCECATDDREGKDPTAAKDLFILLSLSAAGHVEVSPTRMAPNRPHTNVLSPEAHDESSKQVEAVRVASPYFHN